MFRCWICHASSGETHINHFFQILLSVSCQDDLSPTNLPSSLCNLKNLQRMNANHCCIKCHWTSDSCAPPPSSLSLHTQTSLRLGLITVGNLNWLDDSMHCGRGGRGWGEEGPLGLGQFCRFIMQMRLIDLINSLTLTWSSPTNLQATNSETHSCN